MQGLQGLGRERAAPGFRAVTQRAAERRRQLTAQCAIAISELEHVRLLGSLPGLPGLFIDCRVEATQQHRLLIAVQRSGLRQHLRGLFIQQALEFVAAQHFHQQRPITHIIRPQQLITPQIDLAGPQQLLRFRRLPQLVRQRFITALLHQPLAIALGTGQRVGVAQVQAQGHRRAGLQCGERMGCQQRQAFSVGLPHQVIVIGGGQQPTQRKAPVIHAP